MSPRRILKLVRPHERRRLRQWFVWCLLIAAAVNVPFAVNRVVLVNASAPAGSTRRADNDTPANWPGVTPHIEPWPAPQYWTEWKGLGKWYFDVRWSNPDPDKNGFAMTLRLSGWPLPVLEQRRMWWDWDNPALEGPKAEPPIQLMPVGFILNPIIVGGSAWLLMVALFLLTTIRRRANRSRRGLCLECGYDLAGQSIKEACNSPTCPECGATPDELGGHPA